MARCSELCCRSVWAACLLVRETLVRPVSRRTLITDAAKELEKSKMARFDERSGNLYVTELGRVASHFYIRHVSIVTFNDMLSRHMDESKVKP